MSTAIGTVLLALLVTAGCSSGPTPWEAHGEAKWSQRSQLFNLTTSKDDVIEGYNSRYEALAGSFDAPDDCALAEELAFRLDPIGGRCDDLDEVSVAVVLVVAIDARADFFGREGEGDDDDPPVDTAEPLTEVGERVDGEFDLLVVVERFGVEFFRPFLHVALVCAG